MVMSAMLKKVRGWVCAHAAGDCDAAGSTGGFNRDAWRCADGRKERGRFITTYRCRRKRAQRG